MQVSNHKPDIRSVGKVILTDEYNLSFPVAGIVAELLVEEGDYVQANDVIARLDTSTFEAELAGALSEFAVAEANLQRVKAGPYTYEIVEEENAVIAASSEPVLTSAQATAQAANVAAAEARLDYLLNLPLLEDIAVAQAEVEQARASVALVKARLVQAELISPRNGTVVKVFINPQEYAWSGDTVVKLGNPKNLSVETDMYDFEIIHNETGDIGLVTFEALPGIEVEGMVKSIEPNESVARGGSFIVTILLSEVPKGLRSGMTANVVIPLE